jgi:hypothetical protein
MVEPMVPRVSQAHNGTANLFMLFAPLEGWRHVKSRTATPPWIMLTS